MSPANPMPTSDHAAVDGKTGTPRSTSERRGRSQRLSSWLRLNRPSGTSSIPARNRSHSASMNSTQACSSEISEPLLLSIEFEKPRSPPSDGADFSTSSSVKCSNSSSTTLRIRLAIVASPLKTNRRNVKVSPTLSMSEDSKRTDPYPPILKSVIHGVAAATSSVGCSAIAGVGAGACCPAAGVSAGGAGAGAGGAATAGACLDFSSSFLSASTCSCSAFSLASSSSGDAASAGAALPNETSRVSSAANDADRSRAAMPSPPRGRHEAAWAHLAGYRQWSGSGWLAGYVLIFRLRCVGRNFPFGRGRPRLGDVAPEHQAAGDREIEHV